MNWQRDIEVLTPLFNRGAYRDTPELRVPSIRGMVRWWFRALGASVDEEKECFGGMKKFGQRLAGQVNASQLVFRVNQVRAEVAPHTATLPHDRRKLSPQAAFAPGVTFSLEVFSRFGELPLGLAQKVENALEVWLLLGALGLRANRSGGSVWPTTSTAPVTPSDLRTKLSNLGCHWPVMLAGFEAGSSMDQLRAAATDTVGGPDWVFGYARGRDRLASALKIKIVRLENRLRLLITAPDMRVLDEAKRSLRGHRSHPDTWQNI